MHKKLRFWWHRFLNLCFNRPYVADCGHKVPGLEFKVKVGERNWEIVFITNPQFCHECFTKSLVPCFVCGEPIASDDLVSVLSPKDPATYQWPTEVPIFVDEYGERHLVQCGDSPCGFAAMASGVMEYPGEVRHICMGGSPAEKAAASRRPYLKRIA